MSASSMQDKLLITQSEQNINVNVINVSVYNRIRFFFLLLCTCLFYRDMIETESESPNKDFFCDVCGEGFSSKRSLIRHKEYRCKGVLNLDVNLVDGPRLKPPDPPLTLTVNSELESLLNSIDSDYVKWRLSLELKVTSETFPVLFGYRFKNSKSSKLASVCELSDPYLKMYNILVDAHKNFHIKKFVMPK